MEATEEGAGEVLSEDLRFHNISRGEDVLQLVVNVDVTLPEGSTLPGVGILIETGAEVNLIGDGLVPENLLSPSEKSFWFLTTNVKTNERRRETGPDQNELPK